MEITCCWNCGSPLHHRAACTEIISDDEAESTKREFRRLFQARNPAEAASNVGTGLLQPVELKRFLDETDTFYVEADLKLDAIGNPGYTEHDARATHRAHNALNLEIYTRRVKMEKDIIPSMRRARRNVFANDTEYELFMDKVNYTAGLRNSVWEKTSRLLVWSRAAVVLGRNYAKQREDLKGYVVNMNTAIRNRDVNRLLDGENIRRSLAFLEKYWAELRRICHADKVAELDASMNVARTKSSTCLAELANHNCRVQTATNPAYEAEIRRLQQELEARDELINCNICFMNRREFAYPCGHTICGPCAESLLALRVHPR